MAFYVGQKVVCVDAGGEHPEVAASPLQVGSIYTIRGLDMRSMFEEGIFLCEITLPSKMWGELGFRARRFRPVVERKTDISVFTKMLNPSRDEVSA